MRNCLLLLITCMMLVLGSCMQSADLPGPIAPLAINLVKLEWGPPGDGSIAPAGTRTAPQGVDPVTGGVTYYAWFPANGHFDLHWHTYDEYVVVVQGPVTIALGDDVHNLETGGYIVIPGGMPHYWDVPATGDAIILVRRAGPADFNFVNR